MTQDEVKTGLREIMDQLKRSAYDELDDDDELDSDAVETPDNQKDDRIAQLKSNNDHLRSVNNLLVAEKKELEAAIQELIEEKDKITDPNYLRRELAYCQGQLHQSHLTVKQLCGNRSHPSIEPGVTPEAQLSESSLDAIHLLMDEVREMVAWFKNVQDREVIAKMIELPEESDDV